MDKRIEENLVQRFIRQEKETTNRIKRDICFFSVSNAPSPTPENKIDDVTPKHN